MLAHGLLMLNWLGVFIAQTRLTSAKSFDLHRKLGWLSCVLVAAIAVAALNAGAMAIALHRVPPFFFQSVFPCSQLVRCHRLRGRFRIRIGPVPNASWHKRLMLAAVILVTEPAFGRIVPMPLLGAAGPWVERAFQLALFVLPLRHDLRTLGRMHPATLVGPAAITIEQAAIFALAAYAPFAAHAQAIAAS